MDTFWTLAALLTFFGNLGADQDLVRDCIRSELSMVILKRASQSLVEVAKDDLLHGHRYLLVDDSHALVVCVRSVDGRKFAKVEMSYLAARVQMSLDIVLDHFTSDLAKFFQLPTG